MTDLTQTAEEYLAVRRAMGFKLDRHARILIDLVGYLESSGQDTITTRASLEWATRPAGHRRSGQRACQSRACSPDISARSTAAGEIPPADLLPRARRRQAPYLYSEEEIAAVMAGTAGIYFPQRAATYRTLIGLLAVTGLRIGEAIALDRDDVDLAAGCLTVRAGKWNAARELPLHESTVIALAGYRDLRDRYWPRPKVSAFFLSMRGTRVHPGHFRDTFNDLCRQAGVIGRPGGRRPRIHDIRHSFAVATLVDWYREEADVASRLPRLSSYLGRSAPAATYWYLQATPELLALAAERLEAAEDQP
jgi:integrase/recombinase XerD